ncbi:MAG: methyltransferase, partial [Myxococcales bacterium]|nr:methyltransferase [Myxococcales bacterium]
DGLADVACGDVARTWGRDHLVERLGPVSVKVGPESFLQTNTAGCVVLYETLAEALGANGTPAGGTLLDLYCGAGSIGLFLASHFDRVVGLEERQAAVLDARANAERNGVEATFTCAKVEDALHELQDGADVHVVVDPPRAGLHPKVARTLAAQTPASLTYVACNPASLGRDAAILREGGWRLTDLYTVDLFPQTGHIEMIGGFTR